MQAEYGLQTKKGKGRLGWWYLVFMALLALACSAWVTQHIAAALRYHDALGSPLVLWGHPLYAPWAWLVWRGQYPSSVTLAQLLDEYGDTAMLAWIIPQLIILGYFALTSLKPKARNDLHGSAHWATKEEIRKTGLLNGKGIFVGSILMKKTPYALRHDGPEHVLTFAPTRSGKGIGLILPTLLAGWDEGSVLVLDIKGENFALTSGYRASLGQKIFRFEPTDETGKAAKYNPLEEIRIDQPQAIQDAQSIASILVDPDGKGLKDYWDLASFSFLAGAILHCLLLTKHRENRTATMTDLSLLLASPDRDIHEVYTEMAETDYVGIVSELFPELPEKYRTAMRLFIASSGREMLNKGDNEQSGVLNSALVRLSLYRDPVVTENISRCDFHVRDLVDGDKPVSLYLVLSPGHIDRLRPLIRIIVNLLIFRLTEKMEFRDGKTVKPKHRLLLLLDELPALGNLAILERALPYMAGYGMKAFIIVQDVEQLNAAYGQHNSIMANCHIRNAYAPNNIATAELLSKMVGTTTVVERKTSLSGSRMGSLGHASVSIAETARPLLTPDECSRLPGLQKDDQDRVIGGGDILIFVAGHAPIYGHQIVYFLVPMLLQRSLIPPVGASPAFKDALEKGEAHLPPGMESLPAETKTLEQEEPEYEDLLD